MLFNLQAAKTFTDFLLQLLNLSMPYYIGACLTAHQSNLQPLLVASTTFCSLTQCHDTHTSDACVICPHPHQRRIRTGAW